MGGLPVFVDLFAPREMHATKDMRTDGLSVHGGSGLPVVF